MIQNRFTEMDKACDLHTHSYFSDGTLSPTELLDEAEKIGLGAIVLCDHNTVAGLDEFVASAEIRNIHAVPAVEFSTDYRDVELHIIGMFIDGRYYGEINRMMEDFQHRKDKSNEELVKRLNDAGYRISLDGIKAKTHTGRINRAHIAAELTCMGYTTDRKDAFNRLLKPSAGFYIPPKRPDVFQTIRFIKSIGAVAVLAHPFLNLKTESKLSEFLAQAKTCGLDAMETMYSLFSKDESAAAVRLADKFDLLQSGGSDFHGTNKPDTMLGTGTGNISVPMIFYEKLYERSLQAKRCEEQV